jgi:DNA-damage-inducible protein J
MKTAAIHSRIDPDTKQKAERILHRLGMSPTEAIRMFYTQITLRNGLPFPVEIPNQETEQALKDSRSGRDLERFDSVDDLIDTWKE